MKYRKKPVIIEAVQWKGEDSIQNIKEMQLFLGGKELEFTFENNYNVEDDNYKMSLYKGSEYEGCSLTIKTLEGNMSASPGDYIIKGVNGEFYPCKPDIFEQTYELVEENFGYLKK